MEHYKKNKIPNKYHPVTTEDISLEKDPTDAIRAKDGRIAKYAPRVLKSYLMTYMNDPSLISAIKRVKKIRFIHDDDPKYQLSKHQWRLLLQNKLKSVMIYDNRENGWEPFQKYKAFSNITKVLLLDNDLNENLIHYLPVMVNLKCLEFSINPETPLNQLKELNSMPKVLSRLETVKIGWSYMEDEEEEEENNIPFSSLAGNLNVVKNLTHLWVEGIKEDVFLEHLPKDCKNLVFFSANFSETSANMHCSYLKAFEKLEGIKIFSDKLGSFIKSFPLPPSIKYVNINFDDVNWDEVSEELLSSTENSFSKKWKNLTNLVTLRISAKHQHEERKKFQDFMELILKSVPNLVNFEFDSLLPEESDLKLDKHNPINLTQIFKACQNYSERLEKIKLSFLKKYRLDFPSVEGLSFPRLKLLQLQNNDLSDSKTLENLFRTIQKPVPEEPLAIVKILLNKIVVGPTQPLLPLLEVLKISLRNSKTTLKIEVKRPTLLKIMYEDLIERMKKVPALQNVPLEVPMGGYYRVKHWKILEFLNEMFKNSEKHELEFLVAEEPDFDENGCVDSDDVDSCDEWE